MNKWEILKILTGVHRLADEEMLDGFGKMVGTVRFELTTF
jgi:hypothetical protein